MDRAELRGFIEKNGQFSFSRSQGPGGQNVNKVNSRVLLCLSLQDMSCLTEGEIGRIREKLGARINSQNELFLQVQEERSQLINRERALDRMVELVEEALFVPRKRKKTRPGRASRQRRLYIKKRQGDKKKTRRSMVFYD